MKNFKKILDYIKPIFLSIVVVLVILEISKLRKEISIEEVSNIFQSLGLIKLFLLMIFGFVAVSPMINYDLLINKEFHSEKTKLEIAKKSIVINSFNNLIGFGGIINIGLRMRYFGEEKDDKSFLKFLIKSFLFDFVGISLLAIISMIYLLISKSHILINYKYILLGGIFYYPVITLLSKIKNETMPISKIYRLKVSLTSIFEWFFACIFFASIGYFLGIKLNLIVIVAIFTIANLTGLASFIPGGLGSMDIVAITAFASIGIDKELVLTWLLLYRIFYYLIPFALGLVLFIKDLGAIFDEKNDQLPSKVIKSIGLDVLSFMLYILGIFMIFSIVAPDEILDIELLKGLNRLDANLIYQFPSLVFGVAFIILGRANKLKVERARKATLLYLILALIYSIATNFGIIEIIYILICLAINIFSREIHYRKQLIYSLENITIDLMIFIATSAVTVVLTTFNYYFASENKYDFLIIPFEESFLEIAIIILVLFALTYPLLSYLRANRVKLGESLDREKVLNLIKKYDCDPETSLALVGDKDIYYYYREEKDQLDQLTRVPSAAISIYTLKSKIIVMGNAFGDPEDIPKLIEKFIKEADEYCYNPVFYEIEEKQTIKLHDYGYNFIKFGETAAVPIENFNLEGRKHKSNRNVMSRFAKNEVEFEIIKPPHSQETLNELKKVSDIWLGGRKEKGFSLGYFRKDYLEICEIAVAKVEGQIIAFANIMPNSEKTWATVDLMRYDREKSPNGVMDFLFLNLFIYESQNGRKYFAMGMSPLSNVGINANSFTEEKLAYLIYKFGYRFYSFEGLRAYKEKFFPIWTPVYLSYSKKTWLFYNVITIFILDILAGKKQEKLS